MQESQKPRQIEAFPDTGQRKFASFESVAGAQATAEFIRVAATTRRGRSP